MKRIGLFGGTFNPVHNGHLALARSARRALCLDRLIVMPAFLPPHKAVSGDVGAAARQRMTVLAFAGEPDTAVSDYETAKGDVSYTVDTLRMLQERFPDDRLYLLMGTDMLLGFRRWRAWEEITALAALAVFRRGPGERAAALAAAEELRREAGAEVLLIENAPLPLSSTEVREKLSRKEDVSALLPAAVSRYIRENSLYGGDDQHADG